MIMENLFLITASVGGLMALVVSFGANAYDMQHVKKQRQMRAHPYSRQLKRRPLVSVIISAHNDSLTIERCLSSLLKSSYRKMEIIVVDNASTDTTKGIVSDVMEKYPTRAIKLISRRSNKSGEALSRIYKRHVTGELIMLLDSASRIHKHALRNCVNHFNLENDLGVVTMKSEILFAYSTASLFKKYEHLLQYRSAKFACVTNSEYVFTIVNALYRRNVFMALSRAAQIAGVSLALTSLSGVRPSNKKARSYYASDAVIYTDSATSFWGLLNQRYYLQLRRLQALQEQVQLVIKNSSEYTRFLKWFRLPLALCIGIVGLFVPILLSYVIYVALELHEPNLLILSWATLGILLLMAIWGDEDLSFRAKLTYSVLAPITYGAFYLMSFVQIFAVIRRLTYPLVRPALASRARAIKF
jgi:cellulose synthase/poly-beta-1,6-N-acetylglucosamine synthase-like glycosyltransferase